LGKANETKGIESTYMLGFTLSKYKYATAKATQDYLLVQLMVWTGIELWEPF
jgi:hypothetical protein